jgi:TonB family protein
MNQLFQYLLQSSACLAALYLVYWLFLRRETFFVLNRFYLVAAALLSLIIPLIRPDLAQIGAARSVIIYLDPVIITPERISHATSYLHSGIQAGWIIYFTGVTIFLVRFLFQLFQLMLIVRRHKITRKAGINLVFMDRGYAPFSFFNYIFFHPREDDPGSESILRHEEIHVMQRHSVDLIIMELLVIVQWFNPFAWFINHSVKTVHEFLADEGAIRNGCARKEYQELLLKHVQGIQVNTISNNFNFSLLKTRFIMMTRSRSSVWAKGKFFFALPAFMAVLFIFSSASFSRIVAQSAQSTDKTQAQPAPAGQDQKSSTKSSESNKSAQQSKSEGKYVAPVSEMTTTSTGEPCYTVVEKQPSFVGGQEGLVKFLQENIQYPEVAKKNGVQGKVYVTFVIKADGSVADVKILRGVGAGCDEEAFRVVKMMPKWNPGLQKGKPVNVAYNLPIMFKLDNKSKTEEKKK